MTLQRFRILLYGLTIAALVAVNLHVHAQVQQAGTTLVQLSSAYASLTPISATAAVNTQTTLTIPAPASNQFNYVCYLHLNLSQNGTASLTTQGTTSSTNFNSWATKFSTAAVVNGDVDWTWNWGSPATGCAKSAAAGTATTFVSPGATTNSAFTWTAVYYQAP